MQSKPITHNPQHEIRLWDGASRAHNGYRCIGGLRAADGTLNGECHGHYPGPDCPYCERHVKIVELEPK